MDQGAEQRARNVLFHTEYPIHPQPPLTQKPATTVRPRHVRFSKEPADAVSPATEATRSKTLYDLTVAPRGAATTAPPPTSSLPEKHGSRADGDMSMPYPFLNPHYHDNAFTRTVDWMKMPSLDPHKHLGFQGCHEKHRDGQPHPYIQCYITSELDSAYNQWAARKRAEKQDRAARHADMMVVPPEVKSLPGHYGPSRVETSSQVIGQYLDLLPPPPAKYLQDDPKLDPKKFPPVQIRVKFQRSNISDQPLIPDHSFAVPPHEMLSQDKTSYTQGHEGLPFEAMPPGILANKPYQLSTSITSLGGIIGERKTGTTWPVYTPTGLELNRPIMDCVHVVKGCLPATNAKDPQQQTQQQMKAARCGEGEEMVVSERTVPHIYSVYSHNSGNTALPGAVRQVARKCAPMEQHPPDLKPNPCQQGWKNPSYYPRPLSHKPQLKCI